MIIAILRPMLSPIYPNKRAPIGLKIIAEQKTKEKRSEDAYFSDGGKNKSFKNSAMCT